MRWGLVGSPGEKRAVAFQAALIACGHPPAVWCSWEALARDPGTSASMFAGCDVVRIEAPGGDAATWSALLGAIGSAHHADTWPSGRQRHLALRTVLSGLRGVARFHNHPDDLLAMSDKAETKQRLERAEIATPPSIPEVADATALRSSLERCAWPAVFVKPRWGAGGAGILALRWRDGPRGRQEVAITTLAGHPDRPRAAKRLRRINDPGEITAWLDLILADGAVVERWIPKRSIDGGPVDLRVLVIAGVARHRIGRCGSGPITNLHLDARRLDFTEVFREAPAGSAEQVLELAQRALSVFPGASYAGVDLLVDQRWKPAIGEVNGWGDLLPRLLHDGEDTFTAEIRAMDEA